MKQQQYVGLDVSLEQTSICVVDDAGATSSPTPRCTASRRPSARPSGQGKPLSLAERPTRCSRSSQCLLMGDQRLESLSLH